MINCALRKTFLISIASVSLAILPTSYLLLGKAPSSVDDPAQALGLYLKALYARDFTAAYRFISSADRQLKDERTYIRERGPFSGFALKVARRLASFIEATPVEQKMAENHAHIKLKLKLPDANRLSTALLEWDEERLNSLPVSEQMALLEKLEQWKKEGKIEVLDGNEEFELVREGGRWRVFLDWAAGVRVIFNASVSPASSFAAEPVQKEVLIRPGELFTIAYRVKNLSQREVSTRIIHHVEPKGMAQHLDIVECGLLFPVRLSPGEKQEYSATYLVRGDLPEGVKRLAVTYEFKMNEK